MPEEIRIEVKEKLTKKQKEQIAKIIQEMETEEFRARPETEVNMSPRDVAWYIAYKTDAGGPPGR